MTDAAQELKDLQAQIEILKAQKEVQQYEQVVEEVTADPKERESKRYSAALQAGEDFRIVKSSRVRCWGVIVSHILLPPVASVVYSAKTENWAPTAIATGVAVIGIPMAVFDAGLTFGIVAPVTSAAMIVNQVKDDRKRAKFIGPEEADVAYFSRSF